MALFPDTPRSACSSLRSSSRCHGRNSGELWATPVFSHRRLHENASRWVLTNSSYRLMPGSLLLGVAFSLRRAETNAARSFGLRSLAFFRTSRAGVDALLDPQATPVTATMATTSSASDNRR